MHASGQSDAGASSVCTMQQKNMQLDVTRMTLGSCAEAPPHTIRLVGKRKPVIFFVVFFFRVQQHSRALVTHGCFSDDT